MQLRTTTYVLGILGLSLILGGCARQRRPRGTPEDFRDALKILQERRGRELTEVEKQMIRDMKEEQRQEQRQESYGPPKSPGGGMEVRHIQHPGRYDDGGNRDPSNVYHFDKFGGTLHGWEERQKRHKRTQEYDRNND